MKPIVIAVVFPPIRTYHEGHYQYIRTIFFESCAESICSRQRPMIKRELDLIACAN